VVVVAAAVALAVTDPFRVPASSGSGVSYHTDTFTVREEPLTSQTQVDATLGDAGSYSVANQALGTITWLPAAGQVIQPGQVLYRVSDSPVVLLQGNVPSYRDLSDGVTGSDVTELNAALVQLGYATAADLGPRSGWDDFSAATADALERLQQHLGLTATGTLPLGQAVFLPSAALITGPGSAAVVGGTAPPGSVILTATSTTPVVTVDLPAAQQSEIRDGEQVAITLPDGASTPGVVSSVSTVAASSSSSASSPGSSGSGGNATSGSSPTITVLVSLSDPKAAAGLNQAPVEVTITTGNASTALVVPVDALLALSGGRYAVEVIDPGGSHHLVTVTPGVTDDAAGLVQVTGAGLAAGQKVVMPAS
jgi:Putative peptidoglycan binding domain